MGRSRHCSDGAAHTTARLLTLLAVFAVAFGFIEGAVAHYLRLHLYPEGFDRSTSLRVDVHILVVELGREVATLVAIASVAALTPGPAIRRLANFVAVFAVWDLSYYATLRLFEGWPASLADWDLLFLLPIPWFGPVLAPIAISAMGLAGALSVHLILDRRPRLIVPWPSFLLVNAALLAWESSFLVHGSSGSEFPARYRWPLLTLGVVCCAVGYLLAWRRSLTASDRSEARLRRSV